MKNEGIFDRILRGILGFGCFALGYFYFGNGWRYLFYFVGLILIITSLTGYCGLYKLLKISTVKKESGKKKFVPAKKEAKV